MKNKFEIMTPNEIKNDITKQIHDAIKGGKKSFVLSAIIFVLDKKHKGRPKVFRATNYLIINPENLTGMQKPGWWEWWSNLLPRKVRKENE